MTVKSIIGTKGSEVLTIEPTAKLRAAVKRMSERRIGALVVQGADNRVVGIISERDVVHALADHGCDVLDDPVSQVMTRNVVACTMSDTVSAIMSRMTSGKFRHVPVIEQNRLVGIISIGDVVKYRLGEMEGESAALRDYIATA